MGYTANPRDRLQQPHFINVVRRVSHQIEQPISRTDPSTTAGDESSVRAHTMAPFTISDDEFSSLRGSVAVITGGSSGIGLACAELLLAQGANVVIGDIQAPPPKILADGAAFVPVDVTSWEHLKILFENTVKTFGRVDHVFANAGMNQD